MAKPVIIHVNPFDANKDHEIMFSWSGNRACKNRVIIRNNETNNVVYDELIPSFELKHTIPARKLENGKKYVIQVQVYDLEGVESPLSDKILFYTFVTPDFYFDDLSEHSTISNSSFKATIHYYSEDWENISKYVFYLYDASKRQLLESNELIDDVDISYVYRGLENNTLYYIRCVGVTVNGMEIDTGYTEINVKYKNPNTYAHIYTKALPSQGCVQISSNLVIIQYNGTDDFTYEGSKINLIDKTLYYDEGFLIEKDYTLIIRGTHLWRTAEILKMKNNKLGLTLSSRIYTDGTLRFKLSVPNGVCNYLIYSNPQNYTEQDMITIAIRCENNLYKLETFINGIKT